MQDELSSADRDRLRWDEVIQADMDALIWLCPASLCPPVGRERDLWARCAAAAAWPFRPRGGGPLGCCRGRRGHCSRGTGTLAGHASALGARSLSVPLCCRERQAPASPASHRQPSASCSGAAAGLAAHSQ
eukprot:5996356-Lingulodinium_polyedra.AAC.1